MLLLSGSYKTCFKGGAGLSSENALKTAVVVARLTYLGVTLFPLCALAEHVVFG